MLADKISGGLHASIYHRQMLDGAQQIIQDAGRFALDREVLRAAACVTEAMPSSVLQALPLCRLPYPRTWIEYAANDRPATSAAPAASPCRVGLLCESVDNLPDEITATVFWHSGDKNHGVEICPVALLVDLTLNGRLAQVQELAAQKRDSSIDVLRETLLASRRTRNHKVAADPGELRAAMTLSNRIYFVGSRYFAPLASAIVRCSGKDALEGLLRLSRPGAEAEAALLLGTLMLLNTRNGTVRRASDLSRLNAARARRGAKPLLDHWVVTLRLNRAQRHMAQSDAFSQMQLRAHLVRGHFKLRRSGIYWWTPHIRGDVRSGMIRKDYDVKL